jgi:cytochrome c-type biogenesis protein CcmH
MNEWWLVFSLISLAMLAMMLVFYPLKMRGINIGLCAPIGFILIGLAYWHWGAWSAWRHYVHQTIRYQQAQTIIKSLHGTEELIQKLKARLNDSPESAKGWYLLGRLYVSQHQWQQANDAFYKAHRLKPSDEKITLNYVQNAWQLNQGVYDSQSRQLLKDLLKNNPNQLDALAMLAMDAYKRYDYRLAIEFWQRMLLLVPPQSEDAQAIRKAIVKAQGKL